MFFLSYWECKYQEQTVRNSRAYRIRAHTFIRTLCTITRFIRTSRPAAVPPAMAEAEEEAAAELDAAGDVAGAGGTTWQAPPTPPAKGHARALGVDESSPPGSSLGATRGGSGEGLAGALSSMAAMAVAPLALQVEVVAPVASSATSPVATWQGSLASSGDEGGPGPATGATPQQDEARAAKMETPEEAPAAMAAANDPARLADAAGAAPAPVTLPAAGVSWGGGPVLGRSNAASVGLCVRLQIAALRQGMVQQQSPAAAMAGLWTFLPFG